MLKSTLILLALVFIVFAGNAYAWDLEVYSYAEYGEYEDFHTDDVDSSLYGWSSYVNYELHSHISGNGTGCHVQAEIRNEDDSRHVYTGLWIPGVDSKSGAFDTDDEVIVIMSTAIAGSCAWAEAYARFNWGGK